MPESPAPHPESRPEPAAGGEGLKQSEAASLNIDAGPGTTTTITVIDWRALHVWQIQPLRDVLAIVLFCGVLYLGYSLRLVTVPLLLALLLAYLVEPLVCAITRGRHITRGGAAAILIVVAVLMVAVPVTVGIGAGALQGAAYVQTLASNVQTLWRTVEHPDDPRIPRMLPSDRWRKFGLWLTDLKREAGRQEIKKEAEAGLGPGAAGGLNTAEGRAGVTNSPNTPGSPLHPASLRTPTNDNGAGEPSGMAAPTSTDPAHDPALPPKLKRIVGTEKVDPPPLTIAAPEIVSKVEADAAQQAAAAAERKAAGAAAPPSPLAPPGLKPPEVVPVATAPGVRDIIFDPDEIDTRPPPNPSAVLTFQAAEWIVETVKRNSAQIGASFIETSAGALRGGLGIAESIFTLAFGTFLTGFFFFYICTNYTRVSAFFAGLVPDKSRPQVVHLAQRMDAVISGFVRGRLLIGVILIAYYTLAFWAIGISVPLLLGPIIGILSLIPYASSLSVPIAILLLVVQPGWAAWQSEWWWIIGGPMLVYGFAQGLDDYFLSPKIQGKQTGMDTPTILFASISGGVLAGFYGLLVAIPVAACIKIVMQEVVWPRYKAWRAGHVRDPLPTLVKASAEQGGHPVAAHETIHAKLE
ncbi:hypothetical protein BH11PLA1_BH11PLA1_23890 [soil metagenome]